MKAWNKLLTGIKTFLKKPKKRSVYAVTGGQFLGEFFVYMEQRDDMMCFLSLPHMKIRNIPVEKFYYGTENKILDKVEKVPRNVYTLCKKQYIKNRGCA